MYVVLVLYKIIDFVSATKIVYLVKNYIIELYTPKRLKFPTERISAVGSSQSINLTGL